MFKFQNSNEFEQIRPSLLATSKLFYVSPEHFFNFKNSFYNWETLQINNFFFDKN